jgi:hypothetical protein
MKPTRYKALRKKINDKGRRALTDLERKEAVALGLIK